jgi:hypothetical protein
VNIIFTGVDLNLSTQNICHPDSENLKDKTMEYISDSLSLIDQETYFNSLFELEEARKNKKIKKGTKMIFELGTQVFYLHKNKVACGNILAIMTIENLNDEWPHTYEDNTVNTLFGASGVFYGTKHGEFNKENVFLTVQQLLENLAKTEV